MSLRRTLRRVLLVLGSAALALVLVFAGAVTWLWTTADVHTAGRVDFDEKLAVPPLAESRVDDRGRRVFDLSMRTGSKEFRPGRSTPTWGFNGDHLGPTLRAKRGERVLVNVRNELPEASTVHWHGMRLPARMDGGPHQMVPPRGRWSPAWEVDQPAATLWYHPHPHGATAKHVRRGLAGMFILDDERSADLKLPDDYGVDDIPVIVQDVRFDGDRFDDGQPLMSNSGSLGDRTMVNGTLAPYHEVRDEAVRLRLVNASSARVYSFGFADGRDFSLVGTDGGLLERPVGLSRLEMSPGERAEIVLRMRPGGRTVLRSFPHDGGDAWQDRFNGNDDSFDVLQLRAAGTLRDSPALPGELVRPGLPDGGDAVRTRDFGLRTSGINGREMAMDRIDFAVTRGTTEIWKVTNEDGVPHNFHVHDVRFRVLSVDGREPPPELRGPKDTVHMPGGRSVRLAVAFDGPADPDTPYMYHCHLLRHEDRGMMGQFVVVEKGGRPGTVDAPDPHGGH
ncbi:multicopper oxidase family protein [Streptomyces lycii]|uniref:Multicopper oxidase domain-containing protein n=1 Tax=Streptomyces lycii TaxID=2654337 RepID=A0ABQ7FEA0_9ACTN|nr:multicopper oxidase domain-containing protein [Streptomyces lycii]KAF4407321.1 multicopper oxidase domain-containing protein [Streptomyces lycii]